MAVLTKLYLLGGIAIALVAEFGVLTLCFQAIKLQAWLYFFLAVFSLVKPDLFHVQDMWSGFPKQINKDLIVYPLMMYWSTTVRVLIWFEEIIFRSELEEVYDKVPLVFIVGHPRSGTTNLHKSISSLPQAMCGYQFDWPAASLIQKYACQTVKHVLSAFLFKFTMKGETANHKMGITEELEEDFWMIWLQKGHLKGMGQASGYLAESRTILTEAISYEKRHLQFVK